MTSESGLPPVLPPRRFDLDEWVWAEDEHGCTFHSKIWGYEDGRLRGRDRGRCKGWAYWVSTQEAEGRSRDLLLCEDRLRKVDEGGS